MLTKIERRALQEVEKHGGTMRETEMVFAAMGQSREQAYGEVQGLIFARRLNRIWSREDGYFVHLTDKGRADLKSEVKDAN